MVITYWSLFVCMLVDRLTCEVAVGVNVSVVCLYVSILVMNW